MQLRFDKPFTQQEAIPPAGIQAAIEILSSGRLHRYNTIGGEESSTSLLERAFADWQDADYCLACASGGQALQISMRAAGVAPGDDVLTNAFTLAPVPGAIAAVGAVPKLVEITENLVIDLDDLARKIATTGARYLLLSHMRGHLVDMDRLMELSARHGLIVIEDCAHTMGAEWDGRKSGNFGIAGCFSTQTYKHMNSGEGGLITSSDPEFMARAIMLSGSYMLFDRHGAGPDTRWFDDISLDTPNMSARMDNLRAAILLPQLAALDQKIEAWNERYDLIANTLDAEGMTVLPWRDPRGKFVGSSIQFRLPRISETEALAFMARLALRGVEVKWFGAPKPAGFTSSHHSWRYAGGFDLPRTDAILAGLFDMRLPLSFSTDDCGMIGAILTEEIEPLDGRPNA